MKTELGVFYSKKEIADHQDISDCVKILNLILSHELDTAFKEVTKALQILVTIPTTTAEPERCFSKLKLIKTFLRNSISEDHLNALAMLSIERAMIKTISDFNAIQKFILDKIRRMDFHFKN